MHSILIPAYREASNLEATISRIISALEEAGFSQFEILVIDDASNDGTAELMARLHKDDPRVRAEINQTRTGFGRSIRQGLSLYKGDSLTITMADSSDNPKDIPKYLAEIEAGADCVFGSRFIAGASLEGYPQSKYHINRVVNLAIQILFFHGLNDTTGAFKCYSRNALDAMQPLVSDKFNITVEMPLKAIVRGLTYKILPISWRNQEDRISNLKLGQMAPQYLYSLLIVLLEKWLLGGARPKRLG
jgi:dolichol-phosphate mannosyltransferase